MRNCARVESVISSQVMEVSKTILTQVRDVVSLFLLGGYGRGEGSVIIRPEGIVPLGDYDFLVISNFPHTAPPEAYVSGLESLQREFRLQYPIGVDGIWKFRLPFVDKRIYWYEAKFGGKILFGDERVLNLIPIYSGKDIALNEVFSLIFNRLTGMLKRFNPNFLDCNITEKQREHLIFQSVKGILACGESLLLFNGKYHFSYQKRCEIFCKSFQTDFGKWMLIDPSLKKDYAKATHFKLEPAFDMYDDAVKLWFKAKEHLLHTAAFSLNTTMLRSNVPTKKLKICEKLEDFPVFFQHRSKPQVLDFLIFNRRALKHLKSFNGFLPKRSSFSDIVRASLFYLALALHENGDVDQELLDGALFAVSKIIPAAKKIAMEKDLIRKWQKARNIIFYAWTLCRH